MLSVTAGNFDSYLPLNDLDICCIIAKSINSKCKEFISLLPARSLDVRAFCV